MTIKRTLLAKRPQELGKIKIGGLGETRTSQAGKEYQLPVKHSHFTVTTRQRGKDGNFERDEAVHAKLGPEPKELRGVLMYPEVEDNFHSEMCIYTGPGQKVWTCDGETAVNLKTGETGGCPRLDAGECKCKPYMRLTIQLWDAPLLGYHVLRSTGWETTANIQTALEEIYERFGTLYKCPVRLVVYPATVNYEEGGKNKVSSAYMVALTLDASMEAVAEQMVNAKRLMDTTRGELRALAAGTVQEQAERDEEEADLIQAEYHPDPGVVASVETAERLNGLTEALPEPVDGVEGEDYEVVGGDDAEEEGQDMEEAEEAAEEPEAEPGADGTGQTPFDDMP